jgi:hypothetical protein
MIAMTTLDRKTRERRRTAIWLIGQMTVAATAGLLLASQWIPVWGAFAMVIAALIAGDRLMRAEGGVPIIVYHSVSPEQRWLPWSDQIAITPDGFESQIRMLRRRGFTIMRNADFLVLRRAATPMPPLPVVIHLDDGYLDNWVAALPILRRYNAPATIMVSLDFVEPGDTLRPTMDDVAADGAHSGALAWAGYMNWAEIRAIEASGLVEIEAHGTDHGRVQTGPEIVDHVTPDNWRRLAWLQWRATAGNKSDWHRHEAPPYVGFGTPVRRNAPALTERAWSAERPESKAECLERIAAVLRRSRKTLTEKLGRPPKVFCWPENAVTPEGHRLALEIGFAATTGGRGENRPEENSTVLSRIHAGDRALGWRWGAIDDLQLLAACRAFHGNYYWCLPLFAIRAAGHVTQRLPVRAGRRA